jgi:hypothetical protein
VSHTGFGVLMVVTLKFTICKMCLLKLAYILEECNSSIFKGEDRCSIFMQNVCRFLPDYTLSLYCSHSFATGVHSTILVVRDVTVMIH